MPDWKQGITQHCFIKIMTKRYLIKSFHEWMIETLHTIETFK